MPSSACCPPAASGPVFTVSRPIFIGAFCAIAGIGNAAAAAVPASIWRRLSLMVIVFLPRLWRPFCREVGREKFNHRDRGGATAIYRPKAWGQPPTAGGAAQ